MIYLNQQESFTEDEAIQLLRKGRYISNNYDSIDQNTYIKKAIKSCRGLPLAIRVISGLDLQTNNDWENVIQRIINKDFRAQELPFDYDFNIFDAFDFSVNQLKQDDRKLFRSLGVFKAENIPVESIISLSELWDISKDDVTSILEMLHRRSLLNFVNDDK